MRKTIRTPIPKGLKQHECQSFKGIINGTTHGGESATGCQNRNAVEVTVLQSRI
jgi:hypothetical protein